MKPVREARTKRSFSPLALFPAPITGRITRVSMSRAPTIFIDTDTTKAVKSNINVLWNSTFTPMLIATSLSKKIMDKGLKKRVIYSSVTAARKKRIKRSQSVKA